ncbi:hypothetical protein [Hahella sp. NBU794]|uniref:hypothetical protein n=1 Tax=Hahella sp. NBU794 TaxID=3422590 RepID=UPI003D6EF3ED
MNVDSVYALATFSVHLLISVNIPDTFNDKRNRERQYILHIVFAPLLTTRSAYSRYPAPLKGFRAIASIHRVFRREKAGVKKENLRSFIVITTGFHFTNLSSCPSSFGSNIAFFGVNSRLNLFAFQPGSTSLLEGMHTK